MVYFEYKSKISGKDSNYTAYTVVILEAMSIVTTISI